jgi:Tol biopolymer transport system component
VWSPDGTRIALTRHRGGEPAQLYIMPSDGATTPERLRESSRVERSESWTSNGNRLAFTRAEETGRDIWVADIDDHLKARPFVNTRYDEMEPRFSRDGKWLAYSSNESGRYEVYVRPYPGPGQKRVVSTDGGGEPRWRADGRELFYRQNDSILAVDVTLGSDVAVLAPRVLFRGQYKLEQGEQSWDVLPDGKTFVMIQDFSKPRTALTIVQNWFEELKKK